MYSYLIDTEIESKFPGGFEWESEEISYNNPASSLVNILRKNLKDHFRIVKSQHLRLWVLKSADRPI